MEGSVFYHKLHTLLVHLGVDDLLLINSKLKE